MKLISKEYTYHITEKDLIEWIKKEHQIKVTHIIQVDGMWGDSDLKEMKEEDRYILVWVQGEEIGPDNHATQELGSEDEGKKGQARADNPGDELPES